jgi:hypothetical protein
MRVMLKAQFDTEKGNELINDGKMAGMIKDVIDRVKPEAAYFLPDDGQRTAYLFFDMEDSSRLPVIAEPLFTGGNAKVTCTPVMNLDDLQKGLSQLG